MIRSLFLLLLLCFNLLIHAQDTINADIVKNYTSYFTIEENKLKGDGASFLLNEMKNAQFVAMGEFHNEATISILTNALLPNLANFGFKHFCIETGPTSAKILERTNANGGCPIQNLYNLNTKYYEVTGDTPIPFFNGIEDAQFLQTALNNNFNLFGIDQEYYSSTPMLIDELLSFHPGNEELTKAGDTLKEYVKTQYSLDNTKEDYPLHRNFLNSTEFKSFFNSLDLNNPQVRTIINDLKETWTIYALYNENLHANLERRVSYMKKHFSEYYKKAITMGEEQPRIFIKMGMYHTMRGLTYNYNYDIGSLTHSLAAFNGTKDLNIACMVRYIRPDVAGEKSSDNLSYKSKWILDRKALLAQGKVDKWAVIDLRPLKELRINRKYIFNNAIWREYVNCYDIILIPPAIYDTTPNYTVSN